MTKLVTRLEAAKTGLSNSALAVLVAWLGIGCEPSPRTAPTPVQNTLAESVIVPQSTLVSKPSPLAELHSDDEYILTGKELLIEVTAIFRAAGNRCNTLVNDLQVFTETHRFAIWAVAKYERAHPDAMVKYSDATRQEASAYRDVSYAAAFVCRDHPQLENAIRRAAGELR
jgi:hypothetical protein